MAKRSIALLLLTAVFLCSFASNAVSSTDKRLEGLVDIKKLVLSLDLETFSGDKKNARVEELALERLQAAGWVPNAECVFTLRLCNSLLTFRGDDELGHFYILPFTRFIIPEKTPRPILTGSYVVVQQSLKSDNDAKMSGFGYIGRGSHISGERYGILPFNKDFIRLLWRDKITSYIFTLTDVDVPEAMKQRYDYELYLKCRFTGKVPEYIRHQANIKHSSAESTNSRQIMEYMLCVDVVGAFLYNTRSKQVIREWLVDPA